VRQPHLRESNVKSLGSPLNKLTARTQTVDLFRSIPLGILLPLQSSVLLTIAIKQLGAPGWAKGLIAGASGIGMLATPFITAVARRLGHPVMLIAGAMCAFAGLGYLIAATGPLWAFVAGTMIAGAMQDAIVPLTTVTFERNYPSAELGKRVSVGMTVKVACAMATGLIIGRFLTNHLDLWWIVVLAGAVAAFMLAWLQTLMPSAPIARVPGTRNRPWPHFHLLAIDKQLRLTLSAWMLMGFGNLMLLPLRVEYLAQPKYGITANAGRIVMLTVTIPSLCRLLALPFFGWVFDRMSFFASRIALNILFAFYVAAFFTGNGGSGLIIGAVAFGVANAGGDLMWSLWVTKFAPRDRVADYMGLHTFFTGVRAVCAPIVAFAVIDHVPLKTVAIGAAMLMLVSAAMLFPEARSERAATAAQA
jgi:MFS family permease